MFQLSGRIDSLRIFSILTAWVIAGCGGNPGAAPVLNQSTYTPTFKNNLGGGEGGTVKKRGDEGSDGEGGYIGDPAKLVVSPAVFDFQVQSVNSFTYAAFTITNVGGQTATSLGAGGLSAPYAFRDGGFPGFRGTCQATLAAQASCTIVLTFHPTALGRFRQSFSVNYNNGGVAVALDGTATDIATLRFTNVSDDNDYYDFGTIAWGVSVTKNIHVLYFGARPASGVTFSGLTGPYRITSNTCPERVTADCDLVVTYTGNVAGSLQQKLKVTYDNSSYAAEDDHVFTGNTSAQVIPATLTLGTVNFGTQLVGTSRTLNVQVAKNGTLPATGVTAILPNGPYAFAGNGIYPGVGGTCAATISANCTIAITFLPTAQASYPGSVTLSFNNGQGQGSAVGTLGGVGGNAAVLTLTPATDPTDFGAHPLYSSNNVTYTLKMNAGAVNATAISIVVNGAAYTYRGGCGSSLTANGSCTFTVRFFPTVAGTSLGTMRISYFDGLQTQTGILKNLTGVGTTNAVLAASATTYDFGGVLVNTTATATLAINYYGGNPAVVTSTTGLGGAFGTSGGGSCGSSIDANCTMVFSFTPSAVQNYSTVVAINYDDGTGVTQTLSITLKGHGIQLHAALLQFAAGTGYDFGNVALSTSKTATLTVTRSGDYAATLVAATGLPSAGINFAGGAFPGSGGTCGTTISGTSCTLVLTWTPVAPGAATAPLTLAYYDGFSNQSISIALRGNAINIAILSANSGAFGALAVGASTDRTIQISNTGTRQTDSLVLTRNISDPFVILSNDCTDQLMPGASCNVLVHFAPEIPGAFADTLAFSYSNGTAQQTMNVALSGSGTIGLLLSVNGNFACVRTAIGEMKCWGQNNNGQLGVGDLNDRGTGALGMGANLPAIKLGARRYPIAVATGFFHACAILDDHSLKCWGSNLYGQLGLGVSTQFVGGQSADMGDALPSVNLGTGKYAVALALGYDHTCALLNDGSVKCFGQNQEGQLGQGDTLDRGTNAGDMGDNLMPVDFGGKAALQISANTSHSCALLEDQSVKCWGNNFFGQLGLGDFANRGDQSGEMGPNLPTVDLGTGRTAKSVATGGAFTCAVLDNSRLKCWGRNENGILGVMYAQDADGNVGLSGDPRFPLPLRGYGIGPNQMGDALATVNLGTGRTVVSVTAANASTCATLDNGAVKCWGQNQYGQLGLGDTTSRGISGSDMGDALPAVDFGSGNVPSQVVSGNLHNCALFTNGRVKCWGNNRYGNLGVNDTTNRGDRAGQMGNSLPYVSF